MGKYWILTVFFSWAISFYGSAQTAPVVVDTVPGVAATAVSKTDSTAIKDSMAAVALLVKAKEQQLQILSKHPYYQLTARAKPLAYQVKKAEPGKEIYFYSLLVLLLFFAILKAVFSKYFTDYLSLFFKTALKQKQIKQQLAQNSLPSLLFNILFVLSISYYIVLLVVRQQTAFPYPLWQLYAATVIIIAVIYIVKFLVLKFAGWLLALKTTTEPYIFSVFLINKIIGVFILPFIACIALSNTSLQNIAITLSWIFLAAVLLYRFSVAFKLFRKSKSIQVFHFLLYIAAFEILPILVFVKAIMHYLK